MQREHLLHADAVRYAADGDRLLNAAMLLGDDGTLIDLDALTGTFLDLDMHLHGVAHQDFGHFLDLRFGQLFDEIHGIFPPDI